MDLISSTEAARLIGVSTVALHHWRAKGTGPRVYRGEGRAKHLYDRAECQRFARQRDRLHAVEERLEVLERAVVALSER